MCVHLFRLKDDDLLDVKEEIKDSGGGLSGDDEGLSEGVECSIWNRDVACSRLWKNYVHHSVNSRAYVHENGKEICKDINFGGCSHDLQIICMFGWLAGRAEDSGEVTEKEIKTARNSRIVLDFGVVDATRVLGTDVRAAEFTKDIFIWDGDEESSNHETEDGAGMG
ncbi:hypothetical protein Tco_0140956 [Tanacetum coccineum]